MTHPEVVEVHGTTVLLHSDSDRDNVRFCEALHKIADITTVMRETREEKEK